MQTIQSPDHLSVNLLDFAYNVGQEPCFSWWDHNNQANSKQEKYQILVAKRLIDFENGDYVSDSGWINSSNNSCVRVDSLSNNLVPGELYYWKVRIVDNHGAQSEFSKPNKFICTDRTDITHPVGIWATSEKSGKSDLPHLGNIVFLRSPKFDINLDELDSAVIKAFSRGSEPEFVQGFDLNVNGQNVAVGSARPQADYYGNGELTGIYYNKYDVSSLLKKTTM